MGEVLNDMLDILTLEDAMELLRKTIAVRDRMCGNLYWNILNADCCRIANRCSELGGDNKEIESLLGVGNFIK